MELRLKSDYGLFGKAACGTWTSFHGHWGGYCKCFWIDIAHKCQNNSGELHELRNKENGAEEIMLKSFEGWWGFDSEVSFKVRTDKIILIKNGVIKIYCSERFCGSWCCKYMTI